MTQRDARKAELKGWRKKNKLLKLFLVHLGLNSHSIKLYMIMSFYSLMCTKHFLEISFQHCSLKTETKRNVLKRKETIKIGRLLNKTKTWPRSPSINYWERGGNLLTPLDTELLPKIIRFFNFFHHSACSGHPSWGRSGPSLCLGGQLLRPRRCSPLEPQPSSGCRFSASTDGSGLIVSSLLKKAEGCGTEVGLQPPLETQLSDVV